jgi:hypothetical protein
MGKIGQILIERPIGSAMSEIKDWLDKIGVKGLDIIMQYDSKLNIAVLKMKYKNKDYEFRSTKQTNCKKNMWAIARVMEFKVRSHLMAIEDFEKSMKAYLSLPNFSGTEAQPSQNCDSCDLGKYYEVLGCDALDSDVQIKARYMNRVKSFHPDMALRKKLTLINEAFAEIKKARGMN